MEFLSQVPPETWVNNAVLLIFLGWTAYMFKMHREERREARWENAEERADMRAVLDRNTEAMGENTKAIGEMRIALERVVLKEAK